MLSTMLAWLQELPFAVAVREGEAWFPMLESVHVIAIAVLFGTLLMMDLRLLGLRGYRAGVRRMIAELLPITWGAFSFAALTGAALFASNATDYWANPFFRWKLFAILLAGINMALFHAGVYRRVADWDEQLPPPRLARLAGGISLVLWTAVVCCGRWIGFSTGLFPPAIAAVTTPAPALPLREPALPLKEFMGHLLQRNAGQLWVWTAYVSDDEGSRYTSPTRATDWDDAESDALTLRQLALALDQPDYRLDAEWPHYLGRLRSAAKDSAAAAERHDFPALLAAGNAVNEACVGCHLHYVPELEGHPVKSTR